VFPNTNNIKNVLEIGFLAGHSADLFLKLNETTIVHSFDSGAFQSVDAGKKYIDQLYPARHILIKGDSKQTIPLFIEKNNVKFDIILIDGGYDYDSVLSDFSNCKHLSHSDTLLIANNVLKDLNLIKYWNKEHTNVWNQFIQENIVEKIQDMDIDVGRGSVIGKYIL
jgi:predicted O-methyltransferase YrrM